MLSRFFAPKKTQNNFDVEAVTVDRDDISGLLKQHKMVLSQLSLAEKQKNVAAYCINLHAQDVLEAELIKSPIIASECEAIQPLTFKK